MAKREILKFYTVVKQEGERGATRGKVSVGMCEEMGAEDGSVIEFEVSNGLVIGGHVLSKSETKEYLREHARASPKKKEAPAPKKGKAVAKRKADDEDWDDEDEPRAKKGKKAVKPNKRKTKVTYEEPPKKGKPTLKKPKLSFKKKR